MGCHACVQDAAYPVSSNFCWHPLEGLLDVNDPVDATRCQSRVSLSQQGSLLYWAMQGVVQQCTPLLPTHQCGHSTPTTGVMQRGIVLGTKALGQAHKGLEIAVEAVLWAGQHAIKAW